jgi:hypothetical protein
MKTAINLSLTILLLLGYSCKKDSKTIGTEDQPNTPIDFRTKYLGSYTCEVKTTITLYDAMNNPYKKDSTYTAVLDVKKDENALGLTMTNALTNELIFNVAFETEPNFYATRVHGYFFKGDSLYINNSHPSLIYVSIYKGKKTQH